MRVSPGSPADGHLTPAASEIGLPSLLYPGPVPELADSAPGCLADLNLDQVIAEIVARQADHKLARFFWTPLSDPGQVRYRQAVVSDIDGTAMGAGLERAAQGITEVVASLGRLPGFDNPWQRQRHWLTALLKYVNVVSGLGEDLRVGDPGSLALQELAHAVTLHVESESFTVMAATARRLHRELRAVRFCLYFRGSSLWVRPLGDEPDAVAEMAGYFERFTGPAQPAQPEGEPRGRLDRLDAAILERVVELDPGPFAALAEFAGDLGNFVAPDLVRLANEVAFYQGYLDLISRYRAQGLPFCLPTFLPAPPPGPAGTSPEDVLLDLRDTFDLALAGQVFGRAATLVTNDLLLEATARLVVVTGPNQGGKTTLARLFGQVHWLAALGLPVPGRSGLVHGFDRVLTHFDREEQIGDLRGKLLDDLVRVHEMLGRASGRSILILNEIFSSTALEDALELSREILDQIRQLEARCLTVTFLDELATYDPDTVSLVADIDPADPAQRTFRFTRRQADGLAHAVALARKHRVTSDEIRQRISR